MSETVVYLSVSKICVTYPVVFNKIDSNYMVSIRTVVDLCPHFSNPTWALPLRWTGISRKGRVFPTNFRTFVPLKIVSTFFTTEYYTTPILSIRHEGSET